MKRRRINFVTGQLASAALTELLRTLSSKFDYTVTALPAHVAALMKTEYIARKLPTDLEGEIIIPGGCKGALEPIAKISGLKVTRGPVEMMDLPGHFGEKIKPLEYGDQRMKILAEIVDAPTLTIKQIVKRAEEYAKDGADWIDIGCLNQTPFPHLAQAVKELRRLGFKVSIDSANPDELLAGSRAGARMFLSVNSSTMHAAPRLKGKVVVIPDFGKGISSMYRTAGKLIEQGVEVVLDPILNPLAMGAARSIGKYVEVRRKFPEALVMMGVGNLVELAEVDNVGINAMIAGLCAELRIDYALTTEVASWNRGAVAQLATARQVMEYAVERGTLPKGYDPRLLVMRDQKRRGLSARQISGIQKMVKDRNFRIFVAEGKIHIFNKDVYIKSDKAEGIIGNLGVEDADHAFYLGMELQKAQTALELDKNYSQDQPLAWGYITASRGRHKGRKR
ncbi:MAG: DUF6513 domain-containing protein [Nitrospinota bacterium]|nr:DUF6513 domain-containing protein [Nitrospinota bacterium]